MEKSKELPEQVVELLDGQSWMACGLSWNQWLGKVMHYRFWLLHSTKHAPGAKHRPEYVQAESEISSDMFQLVWILEARFFQQSDEADRRVENTFNPLVKHN